VPVVWPLTGRSKELRLIEAALSDRESSGIVIHGEAGVGKTRMAREALSAAGSKGHNVHWIVGASSARSIPLGALTLWAGPGDVGLDLVRGAIASLTATSAGKTAVLGIDDAPLLDDLSTFVVHQIIQRGAAKVVLTIRDDDPVPPATQELWQGGRFDRLDLEPLSRDDTAALVSAAVGGPLDPYAAERLWQLTRGNPLFLRNIVEHEAALGRLLPRDGVWQWSGDLVVPPDVTELVEARMGDLPGAVADVVDALAVGEPLDLQALTNITNAAAIEEADVRGLITVVPDERGMAVRLAHPLYGEVRRDRAASTRLRRLRGAVAGELAARDGDRDNRLVVRRAALMLDSDLEPDPDLLVRGAERAIWLGDWALAERLCDAAYQVSGGPEAIRVLAHLYMLSGRGQQAERLLAEIDIAQLSDDARDGFVFMRSGLRLFALRDPDGAKQVIDDAVDLVPPGSRATIDAARAVHAAAMGDAPTAQDLMTRFTLDELRDHVVGQIANMGSAILGIAGRTSDAIALARNGRARVATSLDSAVVRFGIGDGYVRALVLAGRIAEAFEVTERLRQEAMGVPSVGPLLAVAMGCRATLGAGHIDAACSMLEPIVTTLAFMTEGVGMTYQYLLMQSTALGMAGSTEKAAAALASADQHRHPAWRFAEYEYAIAKAWVAASGGSVSKAIAASLEGAETARAQGQFAAELLCVQNAVQFGHHSSVARLAELEATVEGPRAALVRRFADALCAEDGAELAAVSEAFEDMGDLVAAADAAAHAAMAHRRDGQRGAALTCAIRADMLAQRSGADTPALREAAEPIPLTNREREIARLLGQGLSTRDVAERLTLSLRTVEGHIHRAMTKTGTASRQELVALLSQRNTGRHG
jgi:DNA-binding CsgD family transcriptional regulator